MQIQRRTILLLVAGVIAAFTAVSVRNRLAQAPVVPPTVEVARVIVAKHDLAIGSFVQGPQDLDWGPAPSSPPPMISPSPNTNAGENGAPADIRPHPDNYLREGAVKLTDFNGAVVRRALHAGEPVTQSALMKSGEGGFMSAVLNPGMRAVSIAVNATSGNAGFVSPGDHVDLIVTRRIKLQSGGASSEDSVVSETFVRDVRIVAVDQMLDNPDNKAILAKTVTVEVTPREAEQVAIAAELGKISVALRSLAEPDQKAAKKAEPAKKPDDGTNPIVDLYGDNVQDGAGDASTAPSDNKSIEVPHVQVIRGDQTVNMEFLQGQQ